MEALKFKTVVFWGPAFLFPKAQPTKINFPRPIQIYFPRPSPPKQNPPPLPQGGEGAYKFIFWGPVHQQKLNQCLRLLIQNRHLRFLFLATHHLFFVLPITKTKRLPLVIFFIEGALNAKNTFKILFCCVDPNHQNFEKPKADFGERLVRQNPWPNSKTPSTKPIRGPRAQDPA